MCRNFCCEWQLWWELEVNCIGFIFCRPKKKYTHEFSLPYWLGLGDFLVVWVIFFQRVECVSMLGKLEGSWPYSHFKDIKELLPLEGFLGAFCCTMATGIKFRMWYWYKWFMYEGFLLRRKFGRKKILKKLSKSCPRPPQ